MLPACGLTNSKQLFVETFLLFPPPPTYQLPLSRLSFQISTQVLAFDPCDTCQAGEKKVWKKGQVCHCQEIEEKCRFFTALVWVDCTVRSHHRLKRCQHNPHCCPGNKRIKTEMLYTHYYCAKANIFYTRCIAFQAKTCELTQCIVEPPSRKSRDVN